MAKNTNEKKKNKHGVHGERGYNFMMTCNNPKDKGMSHERMISIAQQSEVLYYVISDEIGAKTGTYHTHFFVCYANAKSLSKQRQLFEGCDVNIKYEDSTFTDCRNYVLKEGKYIGTVKEKTKVWGTQEEWGTMPRDRKRLASDDTIELKIANGMSFNEIRQGLGIVPIRKLEAISEWNLKYRDNLTPKVREMSVYLHLGDCEKFMKSAYNQMDDETYLVSEYRNPFDDYQGEKRIFLHNYKGQIEFDEFLKIISEYKSKVKSRYRNKPTLWTEVDIFCAWSLEDVLRRMLYIEDNATEIFTFDIDAVLSKVNTIFYHFEENGKASYLEIDARQFLNEKDLECQSEAIKNGSAEIIDEIYYSDEEA